MLPYGRQHVDEEDVAAVNDVLRSGFLTTGPAVERFETSLSAVTGDVPCVAMSSGTAALHAAYAAAGVGAGTEIVTSPLTFIATAAAGAHLGAEIRFVDVDDATLCIDPEQAAAAVTDRTRAIVGIDFAGQPCALSELQDLARRHGTLFIEDAAHSIGAAWEDRPVGSIADATCFSFHPVKTITTGEGGAVAVRNPDLLTGVRRFRDHGMVRDAEDMIDPGVGPWHQEAHSFGLNYRLSDIHAALGASQLVKLPSFVARRRAIVERYREFLAGVEGIRLPHVDSRAQPAWHLFTIRVPPEQRRRWFESLRAQGIGVQVHYLPAHLHPVFHRMGWSRGALPRAEAAYDGLISLPLFPSMSDDDVERVASAVAHLATTSGP